MCVSMWFQQILLLFPLGVVTSTSSSIYFLFLRSSFIPSLGHTVARNFLSKIDKSRKDPPCFCSVAHSFACSTIGMINNVIPDKNKQTDRINFYLDGDEVKISGQVGPG